MPASLSAIHVPSGRILAAPLEVASNFLTRGLGLMFRASLPIGSGLLIRPCNSIHMLFMNFAIDAVFLDSSNRILRIYSNLPAWSGVVWFVRGAHSVLELPIGAASGLSRGDQIAIA